MAKANIDVKVGASVPGEFYELIVGGKVQTYNWGEGPLFQGGNDPYSNIGSPIDQSAPPVLNESDTSGSIMNILDEVLSLGSKINPLLGIPSELKRMSDQGIDISEILGPYGQGGNDVKKGTRFMEVIKPAINSIRPKMTTSRVYPELFHVEPPLDREMDSMDLQRITEELEGRGFEEIEIDRFIDAIVNQDVKPK
jgi:hypothetical protein